MEGPARRDAAAGSRGRPPRQRILDRLPRRAPLRSLRFATDPLLQACLAGEATLQPGLAASAVAKVQQALMDLGYRLRDFGPDGVFGLETAGAVAAFHAGIGLGADDRVVGSRTMAALDQRFADETPE